MLALHNKNFEFAIIFIELFSKELDIKHLGDSCFNIFDYALKNRFFTLRHLINPGCFSLSKNNAASDSILPTI